MKRWLLYLLGILTLALLPAQHRVDVGTLEPVEVIYIYKEDDFTAVKTDTGDYGRGATLEKALQDMKASSSGEIFLETVAYALVTEETKVLLEALGEILRPGTAVMLATGEVDAQRVAAYLNVHRPKMQLRMCVNKEIELPKLMNAEGRYYLVQ